MEWLNEANREVRSSEGWTKPGREEKRGKEIKEIKMEGKCTTMKGE